MRAKWRGYSKHSWSSKTYFFNQQRNLISTEFNGKFLSAKQNEIKLNNYRI